MAGSGHPPARHKGVRAIVGPKAVGQLVPSLTKKAFERYGFPAAALLTDWKAIVGPDFARWTAPEKLKWPKATNEDGEAGSQRRSGGSHAPRASGATLVLRVDGPRSIEVQMRGRQLIERINSYFGFRAVTELRIVQAPLTARAEAEPRRLPLKPTAPPVDVSTVKDEGLRAALERMSLGVAGVRRGV